LGAIRPKDRTKDETAQQTKDFFHGRLLYI
jgi:hypothetical protein